MSVINYAKAAERKLYMELYIHIPFCIRKCDYCDFLSFRADEGQQELYINALVKELSKVEISGHRDVTSVFIGGGTPSILKEEWIEKIMETVRKYFTLIPDCEITIEANPGTLSQWKIRSYLQSGINRLSLGCQSTDNCELKALGRIHTYEEFLEGYHLARRDGFSNINIDLMSAIPGQNQKSWEQNLRRIAELEPEHISAYSLIIEEGTPFYDRELELPDEEEERIMYESTADILRQYGYEQYEISNYALPGKECRHNIGYWERDSYLGVGLGAASMIDNVRFSNTADMNKYLRTSGNPDEIRENPEPLSSKEQMEEFMFLGLRMMHGISKARFYELFGMNIDEIYGSQITRFLNAGLLQEGDGSLKLTRRGISLSNQVFVEFLL